MSTDALKIQLQQLWRAFSKVRVILFVILLAVLYGFIVLRIQTLSHAEPDADAIAAQSRATSKPYIDQELVDKINQLEETNVTVKALFDQARKSPFRE